MSDAVNNPAHYNVAGAKYEAIRIIDDWRLGFSLGNAVKYLLRAKHKGNEREDLAKAHWYLRHAAEIGEHPGVLMDQFSITVEEVVGAWMCSQLEAVLFDIACGRITPAAVRLASYISIHFDGDHV